MPFVRVIFYIFIILVRNVRSCALPAREHHASLSEDCCNAICYLLDRPHPPSEKKRVQIRDWGPIKMEMFYIKTG